MDTLLITGTLLSSLFDHNASWPYQTSSQSVIKDFSCSRRSSRAAVNQSPKTTGATEKLKAEHQSVTSHQRLVQNA
jgi:hypothetical protein